MGSIMSGMKETMEENLKKTQDFMINTQRIAVRSTTRTQMHTKLPSLDGETDTDAVNDAREDDCSTTGQIT